MMRKEQPLDRNRKRHVRHNNHHQQNFARLLIRGTQHRIQVPQQECSGQSEADADEDPVQ